MTIANDQSVYRHEYHTLQQPDDSSPLRNGPIGNKLLGSFQTFRSPRMGPILDTIEEYGDISKGKSSSKPVLRTTFGMRSFGTLNKDL